MTPYERAVKRITDARGRWPPTMARMTLKPWPGTGRYAPLRCAECGHESKPLTSTCSLCGERLHEGD